MTIELPADLHPDAVEAIEDFVRCCTEKLTGRWAADMNEGVPAVLTDTRTRRLGRRKRRAA